MRSYAGRMMTPSVHLNGTSRKSLLDQLTAAGLALDAALGALGEAAPNARDYYPQGDGAFKLAMKEHASRVERLRSVYDELSTLTEAVADAPGPGTC